MWKSWSGRDEGKDAYQFGDVTRGVIRGIGGFFAQTEQKEQKEHTQQTQRGGLVTQADRTEQKEQTQQATNQEVQTKNALVPANMDDIWTSFFNRAYEVGFQAVQSGLLTNDEILDQEPFLYLGLPGATVLDAIIRSLPHEQGIR